MVEAGVLDEVSGVFGIHAWPSLPSGTIASKVPLCTCSTPSVLEEACERVPRLYSSCHRALSCSQSDKLAAVVYLVIAADQIGTCLVRRWV